MATMRELKGRIDSVHSSQKITGAMKMISSARLRKAENKLLHANPYRQKLEEIYVHILKSGCDYISPLAESRKISKVAFVVFASDEGLCGAFNLNLYKKLLEAIHKYESPGGVKITVIPVGRNILPEIHRIKNIQVEGPPSAFEQKEYMLATRELADYLMESFLKRKYDRVEVVYAHYKSIGVQIDHIRRFLPLDTEQEERKVIAKEEPWYIYEPDCGAVLSVLYPMLLRALMYEIFLESKTSEQAARILAMQMANDNAMKLLGNLQLEYNKLRQQGITTELLDIAGGSTRGRG